MCDGLFFLSYVWFVLWGWMGFFKGIVLGWFGINDFLKFFGVCNIML